MSCQRGLFQPHQAAEGVGATAALNRGERVGGRQRKGEKQRGKREREESVHYTGWIFPEHRCWNTLLSWPWCRVCMPTACVVPPLLPGSLSGMRTCLWGTLGWPLIQIWASFCGAGWTASLSGLNIVIRCIVSSWGVLQVLPCCDDVNGEGGVPMVPLYVFKEPRNYMFVSNERGHSHPIFPRLKQLNHEVVV